MLILRGVCLLCGSVALHFDPLALVQGLAWRGFLGHFLLSQSAAAAVVGRRADGDLSYSGTFKETQCQMQYILDLPSSIIKHVLNIKG